MQFRKKHRGQFLAAEGISRGADAARANGRLTLAQAAKQYGLKQRDLKTWLESFENWVPDVGHRVEWHHERTPGGRLKIVTYVSPLDDEQVDEVKAIAADRLLYG